MKPFILALIALLIALVALGSTFLERPAQAAAVVDLAPVVARLDVVEKRLTQLEARRTTTEVELPRNSDDVRTATNETQGIDGRLRELERRLEGITAGEARVGAPVGQVRVAETRERPPLDLAELQRRARDAALTEAERLAALRALRGQLGADGIDARLAVLDDVLELARISTDGEVRADVWRQLSRVKDERMKQPMLDALAFDTHAKSREEAAETLAGFLPDAVVEAALRHASENDADQSVRRQAGFSLGGGR